MHDDSRPNPDALLQAVNASGWASAGEGRRGRLKIFFGGCAGVGKTYAMLDAAHQQQREGVTVMVGVVEAHGRVDTLQQLAGLPVLPQRQVVTQGIVLHAFDLDAALACHPQILLLDELAHTNAPGSRHPKRWQDVEELLAAGIDVYTTVNVQHLESLNDVVASITGVQVQETVPDAVFDQASDIVLVDIPPDELLKRLRAGKVYEGAEARRLAAENFFKKSNLIALRELALRHTAERVDAQREDTRLLEGRRSHVSLADKIMVCIGPEPLSIRLVRSAKRLAKALKVPWVALYVDNARHRTLHEEAKRRVDEVLRMAERLGGKTAFVYGDDAVEAIIAYARAHGVTKIIVGKSSRSLFAEIMGGGTLVDKLIRTSGDALDIYVITGSAYPRKSLLRKGNAAATPSRHYLLAILAVALCTVFGLVLQPLLRLEPIDLVMFYLAGGVIAAARWGRLPSMLYSLLSVNCLDFFFIPPVYSLNVYDRAYWMTFAVMLITNLVITGQASRLRERAISARRHKQDTDRFYALTRALAAARDRKQMAQAAAQHIKDSLKESLKDSLKENNAATVSIWVPDNQLQLAMLVGELPHSEDAREMGAMQWCFAHGDHAGHGTMTMPSATGLYLPLNSALGVQGVLAVFSGNAPQHFPFELIASLETFANLLAAAFERASTAELAEIARVETEKEKLRNLLLSAVSHDLRTPLASIIGASSSMILADTAPLPPATITELAKGIHGEARRLARIVTNLLDITRFESGDVRLNLQPYFIQELVGAALTHLQSLLAGHVVVTEAPPDLPMVRVDGTLVEQVLVNLLANAAKYTPQGTHVTITLSQQGDWVQVRIADQGTGIPAGEEKRVFDKFYTLQGQKGQGTGLGLAVCQGVITAHKGTIWVENLSSGGAAFCFTLPAAAHPLEEAGNGTQ